MALLHKFSDVKMLTPESLPLLILNVVTHSWCCFWVSSIAQRQCQVECSIARFPLIIFVMERSVCVLGLVHRSWLPCRYLHDGYKFRPSSFKTMSYLLNSQTVVHWQSSWWKVPEMAKTDLSATPKASQKMHLLALVQPNFKCLNKYLQLFYIHTCKGEECYYLSACVGFIMTIRWRPVWSLRGFSSKGERVWLDLNWIYSWCNWSGGIIVQSVLHDAH